MTPIHNKMQGTVTHWEGLLQASRGALVPEKCFWYLVQFKWSKNAWRYCTKAENKANIKVSDAQGELVTMHKLDHQKHGKH